MKKLILISCYLSIFIIARAQKEDSVIANIHYMSSIIEYVEKKAYESEMVLSISQNRTVFYDRWYMEKKEIRDSVKKAGGGFQEMLRATSKYPTPMHQYVYFNNYPQKGERLFINFMGKDVYYTEKIEPVKWELTNKDTIIAEYNCQSAIGTYRGHKWHVYYTPDIPFSVGPWKLHGLPGAIMYAKEDSGLAIFEAIEVRTPKKALPTPKLDRAIKCTPEEYRKMRIEEAHNPQEFMKNRFGFDSKGRKADGTPIVYKHKTAVFLED